MKQSLFIFSFILISNVLGQDIVQSDHSCTEPQIINPIEIPALNHEAIIPSQSKAGGWSGNGGDFGEVSDNIWFLGDQEIPYCILSSDDYSFTKDELSNLISKSLKKWRGFYEKYSLTGKLGGSIRRRKNTSINFLDDNKRGANFNFKLTENCSNSKLKFFFGIESKIISEYKKYATEHPFGFAVRKSYDHKNFLNSGFIWIKNNSDTSKIEHTLLHELGHIFGMQHDSVYIMRSSMAVELESIKKIEVYNEIESQSWPYRFVNNSSLNLKILKRKSRSRDKCTAKETFLAGKISKTLSGIVDTASSDCISIEIKSLDNENHRKVEFELVIKNISRKTSKTLQGYFKSKRKVLAKQKGPGVFSQFILKSPKGNKKVWRKLSLDKAENYELSGSFQTTGLILPAKIIQDKGALVDLFIPELNRWLTLKSYNQ